MKQFLSFTFVIVLLSAVFSCSTAKTPAQKQLEHQLDSIAGIKAKSALQNMDFLVLADRISFKSGNPIYPAERNTNFIYAHNGKATIQFSNMKGYMGANGLGGLTVEGKISNINSKTNDKRIFYTEFDILGTGVSAKISISLPKNGSNSTVNVYPNFNSNTISVFGKVKPFNAKDIFEGRKL